MTARVLLLAGLVLCGFDVAQLRITGIFLLGVVFLVIAFWLFGGFTAAFWVADAETSARLDAVDVELDRRGLSAPAGGDFPTQATSPSVAPPAGPLNANGVE